LDHLLSAVLLAISANVDNLGVGVAYGVRGRSIGPAHNLLIALVSGGGTLLSMAAGEWVNDFMSEEFANVLGGAIMIAIGFYGVVHAVRRRNGASSQMGRGAAMSTGEAVALAVSLTFNNLGSGLGAGISHVGIALTAVLTTVASVAAIAGGYLLGRRTSFAISRRWVGVAAALLFITVGIYEIFV
jgi:putative Mn2+ efflux pump MntP